MRKKDWIECELGEVCNINMGQSPPSETYNKKSIGLPFFQGKAEFTELYPVVEKWCSKPTKVAEPFDILLSVRAPVGTTNIANQKCAIGRGLAAISYKHDYKYIFYFLRLIEKKLDSQGTGTTFRAISGTIIRNQIIPLAPLPIQRAIVSKTEALFSDLDNGIAQLKTAQAQLKVYRQAVLKKAFEGRLVITNEELRITNYENHSSDNLPNGWKWVKVSDVANVNTGSTPKRGNSKYWENANIPWITSGALNNLFVKKADEYITKFAIKETNCKIVEKGSLLIAMYGEGKTRGKCSELMIDAATNQAIATITLKKEYLDTKSFIKWFFIKIYEDLRLLSSGGVQPNLNLSIVKNTLIPFPTIAEQTQIVSEIERRLSVCDKMEQILKESIAKAEALRQSILKKAFEGTLLTAAEIAACEKEADYEPASILLEKIKAEQLAKKHKTSYAK